MNARAALRQAATPFKRLAIGETLVRRNPLFFPRARRLFDRMASAPAAERLRWMSHRLRRVLRVAARTRYGREVPTPEVLEAWPLLSPATVRARPRAFMRDTWCSIPSSTGGTTGIPLPLVRSPISVAVEQAALDFLVSRSGLDPGRARVAVLRGDDIKRLDDLEPPYWTSALEGRRLICSSNHLKRRTVAAFVDALRTFGADYWWVYPTTLESLARLTAEAGLALRVPMILSSSEVLSPFCRRQAADAFGSRVLDYYGQAERVAFAYSFEDGRYFFLPGYACVELISAGRDPEGALYEIVGTSLWNAAMPLVRYRTGDLIRLSVRASAEEIEEVALGLRPFGGVIGRDREILMAPDGARLTGMDHIHRGVDHVVRMQIVHLQPDRVEVCVIPAPGFSEDDRRQLFSQARAKIPEAMQVEVRLVDELERTPLGKTPFIVRRPGVPAPD